MTLCNIFMGIKEITSWILVFNRRRVAEQVLYTLLLIWLTKTHKKKSHADKSGDLGVFECRRTHEMIHFLFFKSFRTAALDDLAVWAMAPFSWNHGFLRPGTFSSFSAATFLSIATYRTDVTVVEFPISSSKKHDPIIPCVDKAHHTVTFGRCKGRLCKLLGFWNDQYRLFCLLTYPLIWKWASFDINRLSIKLGLPLILSIIFFTELKMCPVIRGFQFLHNLNFVKLKVQIIV